jgi:hypothetical protein
MTDTRACGCAWSTSHTYGCPTGGGRVDSPEIPDAAVEAAIAAFDGQAERIGAVDDAVGQYRDCMYAALSAALPHLLTEVKSMCETATALGLALGRKEMLVEIAARLRPALYASDDGTEFAHTHPEHEGEPECPACWVEHIRQALREVPLRGRRPVSNGLTASSRHPDTPENPEAAESAFPRGCDCYKLPRAADGLLRHHANCVTQPNPEDAKPPQEPTNG